MVRFYYFMREVGGAAAVINGRKKARDVGVLGFVRLKQRWFQDKRGIGGNLSGLMCRETRGDAL